MNQLLRNWMRKLNTIDLLGEFNNRVFNSMYFNIFYKKTVGTISSIVYFSDNPIYRRFQRYLNLSSISTIFAFIVDLNDICFMIAVIKGDIIASRTIKNSEQWLNPLKSVLKKWSKNSKQWEVVWGDFFQIEIEKPTDAFTIALEVKALIKSIDNADSSKKNKIDVRMAIGIGEKTYSGKKVSESNGAAFINSGEKFDQLKKEKRTLAIQTPWEEFDTEMNLYLKLISTFMDNWSISSAELMHTILQNPDVTQEEIGSVLGIKQNSVSGRWNRAKVDEIMEVNSIFCNKLEKLLS